MNPRDAHEDATRPRHGETRHGAIRLVEENCTSCMICARECPVWCISLTSHTEPDPDAPAGGRRTRLVNVLDTFDLDWASCMYCGICIEECPFDALEWAHDHVAPAGDLLALRHGRADLAGEDRRS